MQTSKFVFAVSALAVLVLPLQSQAGPDTPEQAKMRAALRRMMEQTATTSTTPPPAPVKTEAVPVPPPAPAVVAQPAPQAFDSVPPPNDPAKAAQEREAMRQKLAASQAAPTSAPAPAVPTSPVAPAPVASPTVQPVAPAPVAPPPAATTPPSYTQVEAPPSPLPATKQTRLADLLAKYRADTITAQEYHTKRAAILAEP